MALEEQTDMKRYREWVADGLATVGAGYAMLAVFAAVGGAGAAIKLARSISLDSGVQSDSVAYDRNMERSRAAREAVAAAQLASGCA